MRMHIDMDPELMERIDAIAGKRQRSRFVRDAILAALEHETRLRSLAAARGTIAAEGHAWDADPAGWVRAQRRGDARRIG